MATPNAETAQERRTRWRHEESDARRTPGHVFSVCINCGEAWMSANPTGACRRCDSGDVSTTQRCPGCPECSSSLSKRGDA